MIILVVVFFGGLALLNAVPYVHPLGVLTFVAGSPKDLSFVNFQKTRERSKPFVIAVTGVKCPEMSEVYYEWRVKQIDGPAVQTANASFITIDGYEYSSDEVFAKPYEVTVWVSHFEDMHETESISDTFRFIPEKIHLEIVGGLERRHPIYHPLIIDAESLSRDLSYPRGEDEFERDAIKCSVTPEIPGFEIPNQLQFAVPADFLQPNKKYTFTVEVNRTKIPNFVDSQKATQDVLVYDPFDKIFSSPSDLTRETREVYNGTCEIDPKSGVSAITLFKINCTGFHSNTFTVIFLAHQKRKWESYGVLLCVTENPVFYVYLMAGSAEITIRVTDGLESEVRTTLRANVEKYKPPANNSLVHSLKDIILGRFNYSIPNMVKRFEVNKATQIIAAFSVVLNDLKTKLIKEEVQVMYKHLAQSCADLPIFNYELAVQRVTLVKQLITDLPFFHSPTHRILAKSLLHAARGYHQFFKPKGIPMNHNVTYLIITIASKLILFERDHPPTEKRIPAHEYDSYDDFVDDKVQMVDDMDDTAVFATTSIEIAACVHVQALLIGEKQMVVDDGYMKVRYRTMWSKEVEILKYPEANVTISYPDEFKKEFVKKYSYYDYIFFSLGTNPFWWRRDSHKLITKVIYVTFILYCRSYDPLDNYYLLEFQRIKPVETTIITEYNVSDPIVYRLELIYGESTTADIKKIDNDFFLQAANCYCTEEDLANAAVMSGLAHWAMFPRAPTRFLCFAKKDNLTFSYNFSAVSYKCVRWDPDIADWTQDGIKPHFTMADNDRPINCDAYHFSIFAVQGWKPFFKRIENMKMKFRIVKHESYIILIILSVIFLCWLILLFSAWIKDRRSEITNVVWTLDDNVPGDKHAYLIVVFTGTFIDAGTTADVAIQLVGKKRNSRVHIIRTRGLTVLARNTQDWFIMYSPHYLGKVKKIRLWHNCKGKMPHWYCERVLVRHLRSGEQFCFIVEKWFSLVWGDGKICRQIGVVDECHENFRRNKYRIWLQRNFHDSHWFLSVFMRDRQSNFSSVERVGVLMSFFYVFMLASAMTDWVPKFGPEDSIEQKSTFFFELRDVWMFLLCLVVSTPVAVLILILFRLSAPQHHSLFIRRGKEFLCENVT